MSAPAPKAADAAPRPEITEADVDQAIDLCAGDLRATVRALLIGQHYLQAQLEEARREASWGYIRACPSRTARPGPEHPE